MGWLILLVVIGLLGAMIAGWWLWKNSYMEGFGFVLFAIGLISLLIVVLVWPTCYYTTISEIVQYKAFQATIEHSRTRTMDSLERAAIVNGIAEKNEWLANRQYWNRTIFAWFIPDDVEKLEPLK